ncbi:type I pullulanase, partial [Aerococcus urinae]|nr:type I pullulanase [Aerococcus urinae]
THSFESHAKRQKRQLLANSLVLLSQGIPFLHAGQEFFRTKQGVRNSYRHGDRINKIDWSLRDKYRNAEDYLSDLIAFRQAHPV